MTNTALVGDIGGTNSRLGLIELGQTEARDIAVFKNHDYPSLDAVIAHYVEMRGIGELAAAAVDVAGPVSDAGEAILTSLHQWGTLKSESLRVAAKAKRFRLLNDFEALAWSLPHIATSDLLQLGGSPPAKPHVKVVLGPGTGLGGAALAPLPGGGWLPIAGEMGHVTLPMITHDEMSLKDKIMGVDNFSEAEDVLTGPGLLRLYNAIADKPLLTTPEDVRVAGLAGTDAAAVQTLDHFMTFLMRLAGDMAMALQAKGGVYLANSIVRSLVEKLKAPKYRVVFEDKGRLKDWMKDVPLYVINDDFPALKGCAAALNAQ